MTETTPRRSLGGWLKLIGLWFITVLLAFAFTALGLRKVTASAPWGTEFAHYGYPDLMGYAVGGTEMLGGLLLLVPQTAPVGAILLGAVMVGAAGTHVVHGELPRVGFNALYLGLLAIVARARWRRSVLAR